MTRDRWGLALGLVLVVALALRLYGLNFGLPALNDPDELMFELGAVRMLRGATLNPGWFGHPATTTMYGLALVDVLAFASGFAMGLFGSIRAFGEAIYADPSWVILPGRALMVAFSLGVVGLTYRLGRDLADRATGLVAAALIAVNPLQIGWSQIIRSDIMACFFMLACLRAALRIARHGRARDHVRAAAWLALAVATKWPFAMAGLAVAGALALRLAGEWPTMTGAMRRAALRRSAGRLAATGAMAAAFLVLISPYLLLDMPTVLRNLQGEAQLHHLGATGGTAGQNALWYLGGPILAGLGLAGMALVALGVPWMVRQRVALVILGPVLLGFFAVICAQRLVWERWALPLFPLLAIVAGAGLVALGRALRQRLGAGQGTAGLAVVLAALLVPLLMSALGQARARLNDTRQQASRWAVAHVPAGSSVLIEHFAFDLYAQPWRFLFPLGDVGCVDAKAMLQGKVGYGAIDSSRGKRSNVDYGTMAADKRASCRPDFAILTQYDRYAAEQAHFPQEYSAYRQLASSGVIVASFHPKPGQSGGPTVRILRLRP